VCWLAEFLKSFYVLLIWHDGVKRNAIGVLCWQISPNFRTAVTVPYQSWEKFVELVEKAMEQKQAATAAATAESSTEAAPSTS